MRAGTKARSHSRGASEFRNCWGISGRLLRRATLPRTLRTFRVGFIAVLDAVVNVGFADGAERLVIEARGSDSLFQFFRKIVQRLQVIGRSGHFELRSFKELLVALIGELGDFASDQVSGVGEDFGRLV